MSALTLPRAARDSSPLRLGIATLPTFFRYTDEPADVAGLDGGAGWVARAIAAIEGGARGVLVVDPRLDDIEPLRRTAREHRAAVVLDRGWASAPAATLAAPEFARLSAPTALVESRLSALPGHDAIAALLHQSALLRSVVGEVSALRMIRVDATGYDALGTLATGADLSLSAVYSNALGETARVRVIRRAATVVLELGPIDIASPASLRILGERGDNHVLTPWETPHREAWRRLHQAVTASVLPDDLAEFAHDASVIGSALAVATGHESAEPTS